MGPSFFRYITAFIYDVLTLISVWMLATAIALWVNGGNSLQPYQPLFLAYLLLVTYGLFVYCWTHGGQTLGALAWRFRIVDADGKPLTWELASIRFFWCFVSLAAFGVGHWWVLLSDDRQPLHDLMAKTRLEMLPKVSA